MENGISFVNPFDAYHHTPAAAAEHIIDHILYRIAQRKRPPTKMV